MKAMSVQALPMSSMVRAPHPIQADGSGLCLLAAVLSCHATECRIVPAGEQVGFRIGIRQLPDLLVIRHVRQQLAPPVRVNRFEQHAASPEVHVGLKVDDNRRLLKPKETL